MGLLSDLGDFVSLAANPYGAPSKGDWNLTEGSFRVGNKVVKFFFEKAGEDRGKLTGLSEITDTGGRRKVIYEYPYKDGQKLDDLGSKGARYTFNLKFWGSNYQALFKEFIDVVTKSRESGTLTHPVLGQIFCGFTEYEFIHRHDEWNSISIRATFIEDTSKQLDAKNLKPVSANSALRDALTALTDAQKDFSNALGVVTSTLLLAADVQAGLSNQFNSIVGQCGRLLSQLSATFANAKFLKDLAALVNGTGDNYTTISAGITPSTGVANSGGSIPPVFQVGYDQPQTVTSEPAITPQQAVYQMNQARDSIAAAIKYIDDNLGNDGYDLVQMYRGLVVTYQQMVEATAFTSGASVKTYTVPITMSLRMVAFLNGLTADRQGDISDLNPNLDSINFVPAGTKLTVPAA